MPRWLQVSIVSTSLSILLISVAQWGACRFYVLPKVWPWYAKWVGTEYGRAIDPTPMGCADTDSRTVSMMMAVLTTLISLSRDAQ